MYQLESDDRFGPLTRRFAANARKRAKKMMTKQQAQVEKAFDADSSIEMTSIVRNPDASGGLGLADLLKRSPDTPKIVILANGLVQPQDIAQVYPGIGALGMKMLRLISGFRSKVSKKVDGYVGKDTIPSYIVSTTKTIQKELLGDGNCKVIVIRNASKQDLFDAVQFGGGKTVLLVGGHGSLGSLSMTNGRVENSEIPTPKIPLKAFVQHTCAGPREDQSEEMGQRWAGTVFGWKRGTNPIDFIDEPLPYRSGKK